MNGGTVLVVGDVMTDIIAAPEGPIVPGSDRRATIRSRPGGSGANQAVWLAAQGAPVRFAARVGYADLAFYENYFRGRGVIPWLASDRELPSGVLVTLLAPDGERSFLTDRGANLNLDPIDLPDELLIGTSLLLVSGYSLFEERPRLAVLDLMDRARANGLTIAVDPASTGFLAELGAETFLSWTGGADLVFANRDEAALLAGCTDPDEQMRSLSMFFGTVLLKCGAEGALLGGKDGIRHRLIAPSVAVVDTTGAGDAFAAGYIAAWLKGADEASALSAAVEAGSSAVVRIGGQPE